ncbi:MAG: cell envelope integrity EipB family protein [Pseudomonadota bacterium]
MLCVSKRLSLANSTVALAFAIGLVPMSSSVAATAGVVAVHELAPHRAVYDMKLGEMDEKSGIAGLNGRMVYDFSGSACEGYSVNFRFVTEFQNADGGSQVTDLQTTSFEEPKAESYQFLSKTFVDQELVEATRGTARLGQDSRTIELKEPAEKSLDIGREVLFPTEHLLSIMNAAEEGIPFVAADIYDGAETGEKVYSTTTVIGAKAISPVKEGSDGPDAPLAGMSYWPVTVAYFDPTEEEASGELMPVYQLSFWLYENGISGNLKLDYGDFTIQGKMAALELYDEADCAKP